MFEKSGKENKEERRLAQKQKKPNLTKMLDSALPSCTLYKFVTFSISVGLLKWVYSSSTKMSMILSVSILLNCSRARIAVVNSSRVTCEKNHRTKRVKTLQQTFPFWSSSISAKVLEVMNSFEAWESNHGHCLSDISSVKSSFGIIFVEDFVGTTQYQMFYASLSFNPKLKS